MKVLIIGSGGREHALAWKIAQSPKVRKLFCAPGNAGIADLAECVPIPAGDIQALRDFARRRPIDLTVVGPEGPLSEGIVDLFHKEGLRIFGATRRAAEIESSKSFAKSLMVKYRIPTAQGRSFKRYDQAQRYLRQSSAPVVVKADGLAAGKGVIVCETLKEAQEALERIMIKREFGDAGNQVVIEECLRGEEASFLAFTDGKTVLAMPSSQDHKAIYDEDRGPNTGGMGAYSPAPVVTPNVHARVMQEIIQPTLAGMAREGMPFTGFLYAGLMIDAGGRPRVVEFNARLGDPEAQPLLMRLKSDLFELLLHATEGTLDRATLQWDRRTALGVVMAAAGYPGTPAQGDAITGLPAPVEDLMVFHAGTTLADGRLVTSGGRVLCVTALADSVRVAQGKALAAVRTIRFAGAQWRSDIGHRAIKV
jgi:phosphoribosylamine--glycine ligase